jgi:O-antigen ligase/tetratricopeptide (TPR) repeat protein
MIIPDNRWVWRALLILVPLFYNPLSRSKYEPDKVALVILLAALLLGNTIRRGNLPQLARSRVTWALLAYVLIRWLTAIRSIAPTQSIWGDPGWRAGLWLMLAGVIVFVLARHQLATPERRAPAITAALIGSGLVAAYGVGQYLNPFDHREVVRTASTMAHPNLLAAYLAMVMPLAAARMLAGKRRVWWGGLLALQSLCLIYTYSRAGWLAAGSGLAVLGIVQFWIAGRHRLAQGFAALLVIGLVALLILSLLPPLPGDAPHTLQTLTSLFRWKGATAQIRLYGWRASLDAIRARPLLGYGPATFGFVLERYLPPELAPFGGTAALGRRTHNVYLETAVEGGLIGLAAYVVLLAVVLIPLIPRRTQLRAFEIKDEPQRRRDFSGEEGEKGGFLGLYVTEAAIGSSYMNAAILAALVANLVNNVFSFDSATTIVIFWALAGMAHPQPEPIPGTIRLARWGWVISLTGVALALWLVVPDMMVHRGEILAQQGRWAYAVDWLDQASHLAPTRDTVLTVLGRIYADWATESEDAVVWPRGVPVYAELVARWPDMTIYHDQRALYYRRWYSRQGGDAIIQQALESYNTAIRLSPTDPDLWLDRGLTRLQAGDPPGALADFEQANTLLAGYAHYYGAMSIYALETGDRAAAAAWNAQALEAQQDWDDWVWRR